MNYRSASVAATDYRSVACDLSSQITGPLEAHLGYDEVIECVMMLYDKIFFDIHKLIRRNDSQFVEVFPQTLQAALQKLVDGIALLHVHHTPVSRTVPIAECDLSVGEFLPVRAVRNASDSDRIRIVGEIRRGDRSSSSWSLPE